MQNIISLDLEGVLIPEIWQLLANKTNIDAFSLTTRDIADYNELMKHRIQTLAEHDLGFDKIQEVLAMVEPLEGALNFLNELQSRAEVIILSDTFVEFLTPIKEKLNNPFILCNSLTIDVQSSKILSHSMRMEDGKTHAVRALQSINCKVAASGDSYNDLGMLQAADYGAWFCPPQSIKDEYPNMSAFDNYAALRNALFEALGV